MPAVQSRAEYGHDGGSRDRAGEAPEPSANCGAGASMPSDQLEHLTRGLGRRTATECAKVEEEARRFLAVHMISSSRPPRPVVFVCLVSGGEVRSVTGVGLAATASGHVTGAT